MNVVKRKFEPFDKGKVYGSLLILCWATVLLCLILKLLGSKEFEMPEFTYNINVWLRRFINLILYMINSVCFSLILIKRKLSIKEIIIICSISVIPYTINLFQLIKVSVLKIVMELVMYQIIGMLFIKEKWYKILVDTLIISVLVMVYQMLTMLYKSIPIIANNNFFTLLILQIDYYIIILLSILYVFNKGGVTHERWKPILVLFPKRISFKKSVQQDSSILQKESIESTIGFKLFTVILSVFQFMLVFTLCYFINNTTWQFVVVFVSFCVLRAVFGKSYHCNTVIGCTTLSCLVFVIATRVSLPPYLSITCNVLNGCIVAYLMYVLYYYFKYTNSQGITLRRGMSKEDLFEWCSTVELTHIEERLMLQFYVERKSIQSIALSIGYSSENVKKLKAKILKRINEANH